MTETPTTRSRRFRLVDVVVLAVCCGAIAVVGCGDEPELAATAASTTVTPTTTAPTTTTTEPQVGAEAMEAAATVVGFLNEEDVDGLLSFLGKASLDTSIANYPLPRSDSSDALVRALSFLNAVDTRWSITVCEATGSTGRLACVVSATVPLHQALSLAAVDSDMVLQVADDGSVTRLSWAFAPATYGEWVRYWVEDIRPFYDWVEQNHPGDLDLMLTGAHKAPRTDEPSLELWAAYVPGYLESLEG